MKDGADTPRYAFLFLASCVYSPPAYINLQGPTLIYVTPLLNTSAARKSMQPAIDFVTARNGTAIVEELTWFEFFEKYVLVAESVRLPLHTPPAPFSSSKFRGRS